MLIVRTVEVRGVTRTLLVNGDECQICRRRRADCLARPWANHTFEPAIADAAQCPARWLMLPRIPEAEAPHHHLGRHPRPLPATVPIAPVIPLHKDTLL